MRLLLRLCFNFRGFQNPNIAIPITVADFYLKPRALCYTKIYFNSKVFLLKRSFNSDWTYGKGFAVLAKFRKQLNTTPQERR